MWQNHPSILGCSFQRRALSKPLIRSKSHLDHRSVNQSPSRGTVQLDFSSSWRKGSVRELLATRAQSSCRWTRLLFYELMAIQETPAPPITTLHQSWTRFLNVTSTSLTNNSDSMMTCQGGCQRYAPWMSSYCKCRLHFSLTPPLPSSSRGFLPWPAQIPLLRPVVTMDKIIMTSA